jgi:hypothetical protein
MTALAIDRFHARYRLPPDISGTAAGEQDRLRRILAAVLDSGLEAAVQRSGLSGLDGGGELCIREVNALVRLSLGESDAALAAKLALALAAAIESGAAGTRSAGFVRYGSRAHALIDLTVAAVAGDLTRSWAWRSLGLWDAGPAAPAPAVAREVLRALTAEPRHATAALAQLAGEPALFARLLALAPPALWLALSRAVLAAAGATAEVMLPSETATAFEFRADAAWRVMRRSSIARAAMASGATGWAADERRYALAALAVCEAEPALVRTAAARAVVEEVAAEMAEPRSPHPPDPPLPSSPPTPGRGGKDAGHAGEADGPPSPGRCPGLREDDPLGLKQFPAGGRAEGPGFLSPGHRPGLEGGGRPPLETRDGRSAEPHPLPDIRRRGRTRFGGLLFLIHLADRLGLAERIAREPRLAERGPRWGLHQLALALLPAAADDPAALAFAGLLPGDEPPGVEEPAPSEAETAAVQELRGELLLSLRARLDRPRDPEPALLDFICRRDAEIVADPGWLEVHLALDDVRTEIRAAGLDLDPGWVP